MPAPVALALVWHMHQPSYRDPETGSFLLPWTRLHATKDYRDMAAILRRTPGVHVTFNLTPVLLDQLEAIARGVSDPYLDAARKPAAALSASEREFIQRRFFDLNHDRMVAPFPRYRALRDAARQRALTEPELHDLQVWFHLAWTDPLHRHEEPIRSLFAKGEGFTEEEKVALLDWGVRGAGLVVGEYRALEESGQIELITSAHHHPILPLVVSTDAPRGVSATIPLPSPVFRAPEDAVEQVRSARAAHTARFEAPPRGTWPPEGAVDDATLAILAGAGFRWVASDEAVLGAALAKRSGAPAWPAALYRPYRVETEAGSIDMVFRDRKLSDLIGFTYAHWDPRHAAEDFVARVKAAGLAATAGGARRAAPLVTVILDGENCWETYEDDGVPFLTALYELLEKDPGIEALTVSEALERTPPTETLRHVPVGGWIRQDLGIWVGHADKNRAWEELGRARGMLVRVAQGSGAAVSKERIAEGFEAIHAAEASDWFWWYGDDHPSEHRADFDRLFRANLARAYACAGEEAPASLRSSLREDADTTPATGLGLDGTGEGAATIHPRIDGRETEFFEWRDAARYRAAGGSGSMHRTSGALVEVRYGTDGRNLHVRVDLTPEARADHALALALVVVGPPERRIRIALAGKGVPEWAGDSHASGDAGEYAAGEIVEVRIPLSRLAATPSSLVPKEGNEPVDRIRFQIRLERESQPEDVAPASGWFLLRAASQDPRLTHWSAL